MADLNKNQRPRFGSDWDVDLGWVLIWWAFFALVAVIIGSLAYANVQNNRGNVARDNFYAQHCNTISTFVNNNSTNGAKTYLCQSK